MTWTDVLVRSAWGATFVLPAAFAASWLLRTAPAAWRHFLWTGVLAGVLALPVMVRVTPKWGLPGLQAAPAVALPGGPVATQTVVVSTAVSTAAAKPAWNPLLPGWLAGCALAAAWFLTGRLRMRLMVRHAEEAVYARDLLDAAGGHGVRVLESASAPTALALGIWRPVVMLPAGAGKWPLERLRAALLHEWMHVRRRDLLAQAIAQAACCLYWFHPLAWMAARHQRRERERACDDAVLGRGMAAHDYAQHLVESVRALGGRQLGAMTMAEPSDLEARVRALLDRGRDRRPLSRSVALAMVAALAAVLLPSAVITMHAQPAPWFAATVAPEPPDDPAPQQPATVAAAAAPAAAQGAVAAAAPAAPQHASTAAAATAPAATQGAVAAAAPAAPQHASTAAAAPAPAAAQGAVAAAAAPAAPQSSNWRRGRLYVAAAAVAPAAPQQPATAAGAPAPAAAPALGSLSGSVEDPSGARVPRCEVRLANLDGSNERVTHADFAGQFRFAAIPVGRYSLEVRSAGFAALKMQPRVEANQEAVLTARLAVGQVLESVTIVGARPAAAPAPAAAPQPAVRIRVGGMVQPAKVLRRVPPVYPEDLKAKGVTGTVTLRGVIAKDGRLTDLELVNTEIDPGLVTAAMEAARRWVYQPSLLNGEPVAVPTTIDLQFELQQ